MSRRKSAQIRAWAVLLALAAATAGCGKQGSLERPGPLFGHGIGVANEPHQAQDPNRPVQTVDPRDQNYRPDQTTPPTSTAPTGPTAPAPNP